MGSKGLDKRWIFLSVGLAVLVFLKLPLHLTYSPDQKTLGVYKAIEGLPPGTIVYLSVDYGPSSKAEILPMHRALVYHILNRDLKIIAGSVWSSGPPMIDRVFSEVCDELKKQGKEKKYGIDYVNLGYKSGQDVAIAKIGTSIPETFPRDYLGTPVKDIPLMNGVNNFEQIGLLCNLSVGSPGARQWLQQVQTRYKVRMVAGVTAVMAPDLYSFFQSRQIEGFLGGLVGAAEYEYLLKRPGLAMAGMNVQSLTHFLILGFVALGNILFVRDILMQRKAKENKNTTL
jgi:hypothetical protein